MKIQRLVFKIPPKNNVMPDNQDHFYSINAITHLIREHLILERRLELLLLCINLCERWRRSTSLLRRTQAFLRRMSGENYHKRLPMVCKKTIKEGDQYHYNHFWYQGGCVLRPAESVAAFSSSAVELWSKRRKSFTVQVKLVIIYLRRRNGKLWYLYFVPCDGGAVIAAFDPRQPNEIAELRQGGLRGGVDNPFPLNPSFLNYR